MVDFFEVFEAYSRTCDYLDELGVEIPVEGFADE